MRKELKCFFEKLFTEPEFRQLFINTTSAKEGYDLARPYLDNVTFSEFKEGIAYVHKKLYDKHYKEMSEFDLQNISGGNAFGEILKMIDYLT